MKLYRWITCLSMVWLSACSLTNVGVENTPTSIPVVTRPAPANPSPTPAAPTSTLHMLPSPTLPPTATQTQGAPTQPAAPVSTHTLTPAASHTLTPAAPPSEKYPYLDDRSSPTGVIQSLFNAINRVEYARAYSYWSAIADPGPFEAFQKGYADTHDIQVTLGVIGGDVGAGQIYYSVPVLLKAQTSAGANQVYTACYNLHLSNPAMQAVPPFAPLAIESGAAVVAQTGVNETDLLAHACDKTGRATGPQPANPVTKTGDLSPSNYLDDRSTASEVLYSLFNAVNRHEYARAYSYWEKMNSLPSFDTFQKGYAATESVKLSVGAVVFTGTAGNFYFIVPVVIQSTTTSGEAQTFSGCYRLHQNKPSNITIPPVSPIAIFIANVKTAPNTSDVQSLLSQPCATAP